MDSRLRASFRRSLGAFEPATGASYRDLHPDAPPPGTVQACDEVGVLGAVPGVLGTMQAALAVEVLLGRGVDAKGRLTLVDVQALDVRHLAFQRLEGRASPTDLSGASRIWEADPACRAGRHLDETDAAPAGMMFHQITPRSSSKSGRTVGLPSSSTFAPSRARQHGRSQLRPPRASSARRRSHG
ncbi:MAG: hypothetical protein CM15mP128_5560 [Methanobacteriota archaeon]|nr:MAG: hypothetical protein CM15mP128_5560 [Euryarchaeota archaeon]